MRSSLAPNATPLALLAALLLAACGGGEPSSKASGSSSGSQAAAEAPSGPSQATGGGGGADASSGGGEASSGDSESSDAEREGPHVTLSGSGGRAHWVGQAPAPKTLSIDEQAAEACVDHAPVDPVDRSVMVDEAGGLSNVLVEVTVDGAGPAPAEGPYVMDQEGCRYEPHVLVVPVGATVEYHNSDTVGHNVHTYSKRNDSMNKTVTGGGVETQTYAKKDQIEVKCDIHPWMGAWVVVSEGTHTALSGPDGTVALPPLPPGSHKVSAWHETLGTASGTLVVGEDGAIEELDLLLGARSGRRPR